ncbi:hypothetical protein R69658_07953 [Paraburkholderia aspalathi]|uniref:Secreted peptide n=1 Tax=Paraburkholderia aspalathi TaxID=1324617 RepID=A0ABN7NDL0_9BURK|nr:hypothetical protein R69658_07953 [Paraburkholderia aspalathi]
MFVNAFVAYRSSCVAAAMAAAEPVFEIEPALSVTLLPTIVAVLVSDALCVVTVSPSRRPSFVIALLALTVVLAEFRSAPA